MSSPFFEGTVVLSSMWELGCTFLGGNGIAWCMQRFGKWQLQGGHVNKQRALIMTLRTTVKTTGLYLTLNRKKWLVSMLYLVLCALLQKVCFESCIKVLSVWWKWFNVKQLFSLPPLSLNLINLQRNHFGSYTVASGVSSACSFINLELYPITSFSMLQ